MWRAQNPSFSRKSSIFIRTRMAGPALWETVRQDGACRWCGRPELSRPHHCAPARRSPTGQACGRKSHALHRGLVGGSWLTAFTSDIGHGKFDGASLVQNFENLNPSNTLWSKQYNLYSKIDTEAPRYLGFERWWGGHVTLNAEEMQFIVDELFVGNNLAAGRISNCATTVDLRNIQPDRDILFQGRFTPPALALG